MFPWRQRHMELIFSSNVSLDWTGSFLEESWASVPVYPVSKLCMATYSVPQDEQSPLQLRSNLVLAKGYRCTVDIFYCSS